MCVIEDAYDLNNINNEEMLFKDYDEINMLITLINNEHRRERLLKVLNKDKDIMQKCVKK